MNSILFVVSELFPFCKTGGLGDIANYLPKALSNAGVDIRIAIPAYRSVMQQISDVRTVWKGQCDILPAGNRHCAVLQTALPGTDIEVMLIDIATLFDRAGDLYMDDAGKDWPDNALRFSAFCQLIVEVVTGRINIGWQPQLVHCNDWQTGLVPALLSLENSPVATVFTIHNLAYQGNFSRDVFQSLALPDTLWSMQAMEFYGRFSLLKGGLIFSDSLTTVSPSYAEEILTTDYGYGFEGVLRERVDVLNGILNGVDYDDWNPLTDKKLIAPFSSTDLSGKRVNKLALCQRLNLQFQDMLIGLVGRLTSQKGSDLVIEVIPELLKESDVVLAVLGSGDPDYEKAYRRLARRYPRRISVTVAYDENLAHMIEASSDLFLMPSRYEPCGLNQMYSMRYGAVPVVRETGGLRDTVTDTNDVTLANNEATGFTFQDISAHALLTAIRRALHLKRTGAEKWQQIIIRGMQQDFSWQASAQQYLKIYGELLTDRPLVS